MPRYKNILNYVLDANNIISKEPFKKQFKSLERRDWTIIILIIVTLGMLSFRSINTTGRVFKVVHSVLYNVTLVIFAIILAIMIRRSTKDEIGNYKKNYRFYVSKLKVLYDVLKKDFNIKEQKEINKLVQLCDDELSRKTSLNVSFRFLNSVITSIATPILSYIGGLILKEEFDYKLSYLLILLGTIGFAIKLLFNTIRFDTTLTRESKVKSLRSMLIDINIIQF